jgi:uncharacterized membrane protein YqgA involved in biofilm formation
VALLASIDGSLLNAFTVLIGTLIGAFLGDRLPARLHTGLFGVLGLFTVVIGLQDAFGAKNLLIVLGALLLGVLVGEGVDLEGSLNRFGDWVQKKLAHDGSPVSEAFVTSSLVFCVGPLSILGALDNGLTGDITKLAIKATLDGFAALAFSATLGWGVVLSIMVILVYQGSISLAAHAVSPLLSANPGIIDSVTATGGVILIAIGLKLLNIRDLRVANFLPALALAPIIVLIVAQAGALLHAGR